MIFYSIQKTIAEGLVEGRLPNPQTPREKVHVKVEQISYEYSSDEALSTARALGAVMVDHAVDGTTFVEANQAFADDHNIGTFELCLAEHAFSLKSCPGHSLNLCFADGLGYCWRLWVPKTK